MKNNQPFLQQPIVFGDGLPAVIGGRDVRPGFDQDRGIGADGGGSGLIGQSLACLGVCDAGLSEASELIQASGGAAVEKDCPVNGDGEGQSATVVPGGGGAK